MRVFALHAADEKYDAGLQDDQLKLTEPETPKHLSDTVPIETGWIRFNEAGVTGARNLVLIAAPKMAPKTGKLFIGLVRREQTLVVTVYRAKGLKNMDFLGKNDNYVKVFVNGEEKRTSTLDNTGAAPMWGAAATTDGPEGCTGETLEFDNVQTIMSVQMQCWDWDEGGDEKDDLIGQCSLPLADVIDAEREMSGLSWEWAGWRTYSATHSCTLYDLMN